MLTKKEQEEINNIKPGFNIIKEENNYFIMSYSRIEISRIWTKRLLFITLCCNILAILCFSITLVIAALKPLPHYFASTPNGEIYRLTTINIHEKR